MAEQYAAAAKVFREGLAGKVLPADNPAIHFYLAGALELAGDTDGALAAAAEAGRLKPDSAQFAGRRAWIEYHAKRYDAALKSYEALLAKFDDKHDSPESRESLREARSIISNIHVLRGELPQAEEVLEQVLDEFPEYSGALNDLGYLWADGNKHLAKAVRMIEKAVADEPDNQAFRDSLGWAYFRVGRFDDAVRELERAAQADEPDGVILDHLGDAYAKAGRLEKANDAWRRAAEAFDREREAEKAAASRAKMKS
jgi:tetratricopeptide (TPR) repeat protein